MRKLTGLGLAMLLAIPTLAQAAPWEIDKAHTTVAFTVKHFFTNVTGHFTDISGAIDFDPANPAAATAEITIPVASVDTRNEKRDGHLQTPDFFDAANHPNIIFKSTKTTAEGSMLKVAGDLTIRGITKPVVLNVEFLGSGPGSRGNLVAGFVATTTLNRHDWSVSWNNKLDNGGVVLGDDVKVEINIEAIQKPAEKG